MATASSPKSAGKTKQRVVGTAVLVALFIIIVLILPSQNEEETEVLQVVEIPPKPANHNVKVLPIEVPKPARLPNMPKEPGATASASDKIKLKLEPKLKPKPAASKPEVVEKLQVAEKLPDKLVKSPEKLVATAPKTKQSVGQKWVIQVGSFSSKENAEVLRDRLKADNYKVFIDEVSSNGQLNFRVLVGPNADRTKLEPFKIKLEKLLSAPAIIKSYEP
ncbi:MAG: hypothetical protein COC05_02215 [Gammaproteobacteria bacterium]|nr:MAG: hypothetical protein COC05_02215 [Gammaproteobacteria bacterium]